MVLSVMVWCQSVVVCAECGMVPECGGVVLSARHGAECGGVVLSLMYGARVWWCCVKCDGMGPECGGVVLSAMYGARVWWCCAECEAWC